MQKFLRKVLLTLAVLGAVQLSAAPDKPVKKLTNDELKKIRINGVTNKSALSYAEGEEMVFTFNIELNGVSPEGLFIHYERKGDDGVTFSGKVPVDPAKPLVVKTSLAKPGFVSVDAVLYDASGKMLLYQFRFKPRPGYRRIGFFAGAAVKPETLTDCGEPADFDAFWERQRERLAAVPFKGLVSEKLVKTVKGGKIYAVSIPCVSRPATGYLAVPDAADGKKLPAEIVFFGYGAHIQSIPGIRPGKIVLYLNAHGQELGREKEYYKEFFKSIRSNNRSYGFDPEQNKDPETAFFNGMTLRIMRALEYLKSRPEWNGKDLLASGGSQGGLQTIWAAALDQDVTEASPSITWCCDLAGTVKKGRAHGKWRIEYVPALDYYDPVFMAKRITKAKVNVRRAGLGDYTCPPSGLAVCYRNLATPHKKMTWVQGSDHGFVPEKSEVIVWKNK